MRRKRWTVSSTPVFSGPRLSFWHSPLHSFQWVAPCPGPSISSKSAASCRFISFHTRVMSRTMKPAPVAAFPEHRLCGLFYPLLGEGAWRFRGSEGRARSRFSVLTKSCHVHLFHLKTCLSSPQPALSPRGHIWLTAQ